MKTKKLKIWLPLTATALVVVFVTLCLPDAALAASASEIDRNSTQALTTLYQTTPGAEALAEKSKAVLIFPSIVKGGLIEGSVGLQAGAQSFGYVLFFMDNDSLKYLDKSDGWELGTGPTLVVLDKGFSKELTTTTLHKGVYAFVFSEKGLMAGIAIQGAKITKIHPDK
jgi:lipid-binding SYLF domain-containing protein